MEACRQYITKKLRNLHRKATGLIVLCRPRLSKTPYHTSCLANSIMTCSSWFLMPEDTTTTKSEASQEIRNFALRRLEEATEVDAAHRLAALWGMDYVYDEEAVLKAMEARRKLYLQLDDVLPGKSPALISTPTEHWLCRTRAVVDAQKLVAVDEPKLKHLGLARVCQHYFGKPLDKSEQCSLWSTRPLLENQRVYAALDAWACVGVYEKLFPERSSVNGASTL
jgi:hypothetical protein